MVHELDAFKSSVLVAQGPALGSGNCPPRNPVRRQGGGCGIPENDENGVCQQTSPGPYDLPEEDDDNPEAHWEFCRIKCHQVTDCIAYQIAGWQCTLFAGKQCAGQ